MEPLTLTASRGRVTLRLTCVALGRDLSVTLTGGDREHIGAVALGQPRPSLGEGGGVSATTSVLALLGHKEDDLARSLATELASRLDAVVCLACGIHLDGITREELALVDDLARELALGLLERLPRSVGQPPGNAGT